MQQRFLALDGMRGWLALFVIAYHVQDRPQWLAPYIYLAVDFFFMLSGFVLAYAYEQRMREPGAPMGFLRDRFIRLHPLLLLGAIPGGLALLLVRHPNDPHPWLTVISGLIPFPAFWRAEWPRAPFPLNGPSWSLFWELVLNLAFAFAMPYLTPRRLMAVTALSCVALLIVPHFVYVGDGNMIYAGVRAACFPIGISLLHLHRSGRLPAWLDRFGFWASPIMLAIVLVPGPYRELREFAAHFLLFPLVILSSANYASRFPRTCKLAGDLSYPLYVLHMPLMGAIGMALQAVAGHPVSNIWAALLALPAIWAIWRFYDEPLRAWLRKRWGWRRPVAAALAAAR